MVGAGVSFESQTGRSLGGFLRRLRHFGGSDPQIVG